MARLDCAVHRRRDGLLEWMEPCATASTMIFDLNQLAALGLLSAAIHWIVARAKITKWFWSLNWWPAPGSITSGLIKEFFAGLLACAACSGFWIGLGLGLAGVQPLGHGVIGVLSSGLLGVVATPVVEGLLLWGLQTTKMD
jgi:hypothetical protein